MKKGDDGSFKNVFFSTKGGKLLRKLIESGLELKRNEYYVDYAYSMVPRVLQRDKYNRAIKYKPPTQTEANAEYKYLFKRIVKEKPDIIIPTGNIGCKALLGKSAISRLRGVPEKVTVTYTETERGSNTEDETIGTHECWVLPMYSMEYMLVNPSIQNLIEADFVTLKKFVDIGEKAFIASPVDYEFVDTIERVREIFTGLKDKPVVSWDLETNTLHPELPGAKPLVISLSWEEGTGCTIPLEHKDFTWQQENLDEIYEYIKEFVSDPEIVKVGHNIQFDMRFLRLTKGFKKFENNRDTKIMYYVLVNQDVESSLQLSDLAYELTDMGGYDKPLDEFKRQYIKEYVAREKERIRIMKEEHKKKVAQERKLAKEEGRKYVREKVKFPKAEPPRNEIDGSDFNYEWIPLKKMLHPYASGDVDAGLRIYNKLNEIGSKKGNEKLKKLYTQHYPDLNKTLSGVEANGLKMNIEYNEELTSAYYEEEDRVIEEIRKFPEVQQLEEENRILYEKGLAEWAIPKEDRNEEVAKLRDRYKDKLKFNPNSPDDKKRVLYKIPGVSLPYNKEYLVDSAVEDAIPEDAIEWCHYKTNKTSLEYIKSNYEHLSDLADWLLTYSLVKTRRQGFTYKLRNMVDPQGILHGGFNSTGTACVSGDTLLLTGEGIKQIKDISDNRREGTFSDIDITIHSHKGLEKADGFYYSGQRKGVQITLLDGTTLTTTLNHPLLKNTRLSHRKGYDTGNFKEVDWEKAGNLKRGDYIALKLGTELYGDNNTLVWDKEKYSANNKSRTRQANMPTEMSKELAEWLGMYISDGATLQSEDSITLRFTNKDIRVVERYVELSNRVFGLEPDVSTLVCNTYTVLITSSQLVCWIKDVIGLDNGIGNKDVPEPILRGSKEVQQAFIRGLTLNSSVHNQYPSLHFSSVSKMMLEKVKVMLLNMGIYCFLESKQPSTKSNTGYWELVITSYEKLYKYMGEIGVIELHKEKDINKRLKDYLDKKGTQLNDTSSGEYFFVEIADVKEVEEEFFDLHVPENHSFIGNGVVNHNTSRLSSQNPNLQQIPKSTGDPNRFDYKYPIKRMFVTRFEGGALLQLDYSSLESRILALAAKDEEMTQAFLDGADIHKETASLVFGVPPEEVTSDMRNSAKSTTFGEYCRFVS